MSLRCLPALLLSLGALTACVGGVVGPDSDAGTEGEGEGEGAAEGEGEGAAEGEGEGAAEGEGEGAAEGEGETGLTLAALAGVWQLRATDGEGAAAVKGSFELGADGSLVGGRIYVLMLDNPAGERFSLDLGEDGGVRIDDAVARTVTVNLVTAVVTAVGVVDGPASSISGTFDSAMAESGRFDAWRFPVSAGGWRCHPEFRAAADGCDCSCGRDDPDCGEGPCGYCYGEDGSSVDCDE